MDNREKRLIEVSKMYYCYGYSQKKIAEIMNLSRAYVCQLLDTAKREGIVEIQVKDYQVDEHELQKELERQYQLKKALIFKNQKFRSREEMFRGMSGALKELLEEKVGKDSVISFTWGRTLYEITRFFEERDLVSDVKVLPMTGAMGNLTYDMYAADISRNIAKAFGGTPYLLPLPVFVSNEDIKKSVYQDHMIRELLDMAKQANIALFTVGNAGEENVLFQGEYIGKKELANLEKSGMAGDLCAHFLNREGEILSEVYEKRLISVPLKEMKKIPVKICIVFDVAKAGILKSVLRQGYVDYLFVDEDTMRLMCQDE